MLAKAIDYLSIKQYKLKELVKEMFRSPGFGIFLISFLLVNSLCWYAAFKLNKYAEGSQIALHYSVDAGIDYYGESKNIFILPFLGLVVFFVNLIVFVISFKHKDKSFISYLLFVSAVLVNVVLLTAITSIYFVNFK